MRPHHRTTVIALLLVAVVFAVFFRTLESGFLRWDDDINVFENPHVHGLTGENLRWMFTDFEQAIRYKPLSWLAWACVHEIFGLNPFGYHLANVLLHCINTVLVFLLIRRLLQLSSLGSSRDEEAHSKRGTRNAEPGTKSRSLLTSAATQDACAALGALLWAVHPLRVEPVAWVTGLPYGLSLLFLLTATLLYLQAHSPEIGAPERKRAYWLSVATFALAVLSYPIVLGFVAALVALDFFPLRRFGDVRCFFISPIGGKGWGEGAGHAMTKTSPDPLPSEGPGNLRSVLIEKLPFLALSLLLVAGTVYGRFHATGTWDKPVTLDNFPPFARAMQAFYLWAYYLGKPLLPLDLCPVYPVLMESSFNEAPFLLSALGVVAVSALLFAKRRDWPAAFALWLAHLGLLVPMLGLTERPHYSHDRYSIVNGVLIAVAVAALLWHGRDRPWRRPALVIAGILAALCVFASQRQVRVWENDFVFFEELLRRMPPKDQYRAAALLKLGNAHADTDDNAKAEACYREALALHPDTTFVQLPFNFGNVLARQDRWAEAEAAYAKALGLAPRHLAARNNYGIALARQGKFDLAFAQFDESIRLKPDSADTHLNYGIALLGKGDWSRAAESLSRALQLQPQSAEANAQLAEVFTMQGKLEQARQHAAEAKRLRKAIGP